MVVSELKSNYKEKNMESHVCPTSSLYIHETSGRRKPLAGLSYALILLWLSVVILQHAEAAGKSKGFLTTVPSYNLLLKEFFSILEHQINTIMAEETIFMFISQFSHLQ